MKILFECIANIFLIEMLSGVVSGQLKKYIKWKWIFNLKKKGFSLCSAHWELCPVNQKAGVVAHGIN